MKRHGIWVSQTEFVNFGESKKPLTSQIATRSNSIDFYGLGQHLPNPDAVLKALGKDIKVYRELRVDAHVGGCIRRRKSSVKALKWGLEPQQASKTVVDVINAMFTNLDLSRIITEMMDAVLYGYQPLEVMWGKVGGRIVPIDVIGKPAEWFVYDENNVLRLRTKQNRLRGDAVPERKFLVTRQDASYDNPYGFADMSMCFWPALFKKGGLKFWVQFTEKYGAPWVIGKHPRSASEAENNQLLDSLEDMVQDAVAAIPDDSSIQILEAAGKAGSADVYERLLHYCRSEISLALLGQNQTTEATSNLASAKVGLEVTRDIRDGDKAIIEEAFNMLIRWTCDLNFSDAARPVFSMWEQQQVDEVQASRDEKITRAGARLTPQYFKRAYSLEDGDLLETITAATTDKASADFAETTEAPDQDALDAALDSLSVDAINDDAEAILAPLLAQVKNGAQPDALLAMLAELYPAMDASGLQERLARAYFVANIWGRLHAKS